MIKNKKTLLYVVISLVVLYFIVSIIVSIPKTSKYEKTVFIGSNTKINLKDGNINIYNENSELDKLKAKIYFKGDFVDGYISSKKSESSEENIYVAYNEDMNLLLQESALIAYTDNLSIKVKDYNKMDGEDLEEVYKMANSNNITISKNALIDYYKIGCFEDSSSEKEYVYSVGLIEDGTNYDSLVFIKKSSKYILLDRSYSENNTVSNIRLYFSGLIDLNNDNNYEYVIKNAQGEYGTSTYELYNFIKDSFTKIGGDN